MGSTNITGLGKMFVQEQTTKAGMERPEEENTVDFSDIMGQMTAQTENGLFVQNTISGEKDDSFGSKESSDMSYDKYQYRKSEIRSQDLEANQPKEQEVSEEMEAFENDVKEVIRENLGVSDEQIEEAMDMLGLTFLDLMNPGQLARLTAELTGSQDVEVLFDGNFLQMMQEIDALSNTLLEKLGVSEEQLKQLVTVMSTVSVSENSEDTSGSLTENQMLQESGVDAADSGQQTVLSNQTASELSSEHTAVIQESSKENTQESAAELQEIEEPLKEVSDDAETALDETVSFKSVEKDSISQKRTSDSTQDFSQNKQSQSQHTQNQTVFDTAVRQTDAAETPVIQNTEGNLGFSAQVDVADVIRQIVTYTQVHITDQTATLEMQLNPEHLGKLFLELTSHEGTVSARIFTQNEVVKEALESQVADLRQSMNQAGIKVEAIEVTVESHEFERNLEEQARQDQKQAEEQERTAKQTRRINLNELSEIEGIGGVMTDEEVLVAQMMAEQGNSVDFTA